MAVQQPVVVGGDYTEAAGPWNLNTRLPAADNARFFAWVTDRTVGGVVVPGYKYSNGTTWLNTAQEPFAIGIPAARTVAIGTAYQASTPSKPALVSVEIQCTTTVGIGTPQANTIELVIGPTNAIATTGGTRVDVFRQDLSVTLISLGFTGNAILRANLPTGYFFAIRRPVGSGTSIVAAFDQTLGN